MQGIFQKENTDKALKYGIYRHLPTYEKIIRNLVSFSVIKEISSSLSHISGNINQVAKRCNTNQSVTTNDVEQLRREYLQLKSLYQERLVKALRKLV